MSSALYRTLLHEAIENVQKLDLYWRKFYSAGKRQLINSFFIGKIYYDGIQYRTDRLNEVVEEMYLKNNEYLFY